MKQQLIRKANALIYKNSKKEKEIAWILKLILFRICLEFK